MSLAVLADETRPVYESISGGCAGFSEDDVGLSISLLEDIVVASDVFAPWTSQGAFASHRHTRILTPHPA